MPPALLLTIYCVMIALAALAGGWLPVLFRMTHTRLQLAMSFIGGAILGVGLLHLLPHAFYELGSMQAAAAWLLAGFLSMFFIERVFHAHHHGEAELDEHDHAGHDHHHDHAGDHAAHDHHHGEYEFNDGARHHEASPAVAVADPGHSHSHSPAATSGVPLRASWVAALAGLSLHSLLDGVALGASVAAATSDHVHAQWGGLAVFLAIVLHKPFDSLTLGALMAVAGEPIKRRHMVNVLFALVAPAGAVLFTLGSGWLGAVDHTWTGVALAYAAGSFVCIATSDLLPELQFHSHDRVKLSVSLLLGVALSVGLVVLDELTHEHTHDHAADAAHAPHQD